MPLQNSFHVVIEALWPIFGNDAFSGLFERQQLMGGSQCKSSWKGASISAQTELLAATKMYVIQISKINFIKVILMLHILLTLHYICLSVWMGIRWHISI